MRAKNNPKPTRFRFAVALDAKAKGIVTLDEVMAKNAKRLKFRLVAF